jgi:hypothetical protein
MNDPRSREWAEEQYNRFSNPYVSYKYLQGFYDGLLYCKLINLTEFMTLCDENDNLYKIHRNQDNDE